MLAVCGRNDQEHGVIWAQRAKPKGSQASRIGMKCQWCFAALLLSAATALAHPGHDDEARMAGGRNAPEAKVSIEIRDGYRWITSNGLPDHQAGQFPNRNNPNSISPQEYKFKVAVEPVMQD